MRITIVGAAGQLGRDMQDVCLQAGHAVSELDIPAIDITDAESTRHAIEDARPELIINCAAFTAVDECETREDLAFAVNARGVAHLAQAAAQINARMAHISTDYVFDGAARRPYREDDPASPATAYGRSKLEGERLLAQKLPQHFIFRIAWLYGVHGQNFVKTIRRVAQLKAQQGETLQVVADQIGTPTWTREVCAQVLAVCTTDHFGLFHATARGQCSWYDFACRIVARAGIDVRLEPCTTAQFPRPAPRPAYSVLDNARLASLGLDRMLDWEVAFDRFILAEKTDSGLAPAR